ncbi:Anaphase-promoting complex subunit [Sesamum angolense]|uniref:Anaphase-promoting complex subunit n=1 Tax=Sesamum angolense TaxID=2727404 RepID=A0AAE1T720_9LAMI|nr:Anaphase-promoting complex subunit [Sesamum angolense]
MAAAEGSLASPMCNLAILDSLNKNSVGEMTDSWNAFCLATENLLGGGGELSLDSDFVSHVRNLCSRGLESLIVEHFLCSVELISFVSLRVELDLYYLI